MAITLQTIESLPLIEEVNENTSLVGWDGEKTVRVASDMVGGSGLPEGGEPHKQLVTDGEGKTVWEDRLVWKDKIDTVFIPETTFEFEELGPIYLAPTELVSGSFALDEKFTVIWDGTVYECISFADSHGRITVGNLSLFEEGEDTGEPFVFACEEKYIIVSNESGSHTVEVMGKTVVNHQLPYDLAPRLIIDLRTSEGDKTVYEKVYNAYKRGIPIYIKNRIGGYDNVLGISTDESDNLWLLTAFVANFYGQKTDGFATESLMISRNEGLMNFASGSVQIPNPSETTLAYGKALVVKDNTYKVEFARIIFTRDANMDYACNVPYEEFETAVMSGVPIVFIDTLRKSSSTNVSVCKYSERESWSVSAYDAYNEDNVHFTYAPTFIGEV